MFYDLRAEENGKRAVAPAAMRLGYEGIAITHTVTGTVSDADKMSSSKCEAMKMAALLAASPGLEQSSKFHRSLLGVPASAPFRQYSRINVVVEDQVQASALSNANPVLQGYDIVSVQPQNQKMFLLACTQLEVDIISLDFTQKLNFRVKTCNVKAAVERGIVFEICYGPAIADPMVRRDVISNAKLLLASSRGRHVIISSGAKSADEVRGPNDVINLSTLFGFSTEQGKAAISTTCKSVLLHGYTRKKTFKGAISIERVEKPLFEGPIVWEPLANNNDCFLTNSPDDQVETTRIDQLEACQMEEHEHEQDEPEEPPVEPEPEPKPKPAASKPTLKRKQNRRGPKRKKQKV